MRGGPARRRHPESPVPRRARRPGRTRLTESSRQPPDVLQSWICDHIPTRSACPSTTDHGGTSWQAMSQALAFAGNASRYFRSTAEDQNSFSPPQRGEPQYRGEGQFARSLAATQVVKTFLAGSRVRSKSPGKRSESTSGIGPRTPSGVDRLPLPAPSSRPWRAGTWRARPSAGSGPGGQPPVGLNR
jgi:hypothetical protein